MIAPSVIANIYSKEIHQKDVLRTIQENAQQEAEERIVAYLNDELADSRLSRKGKDDSRCTVKGKLQVVAVDWIFFDLQFEGFWDRRAFVGHFA